MGTKFQSSSGNWNRQRRRDLLCHDVLSQMSFLYQISLCPYLSHSYIHLSSLDNRHYSKIAEDGSMASAFPVSSATACWKETFLPRGTGDFRLKSYSGIN